MDASFLYVSCSTIPTAVRGPLSPQNREILSSYALRTYQKLEACSLFQREEAQTTIERGIDWLRSFLPGYRAGGSNAPEAGSTSSEKQATRVVTQKIESESSAGKTKIKGKMVCNAVLFGLSPVIAGTVPVVGGAVATGVSAAGKLAYEFAAKPTTPDILPALNFFGLVTRDEQGNYFSSTGAALHERDVRKIHQAIRQVELASKLYDTNRENIASIVKKYLSSNDLLQASELRAGIDGKVFTREERTYIEDGVECLESDNLMNESLPIEKLIETLTSHIPPFDMGLEIQEFMEDVVLMEKSVL